MSRVLLKIGGAQLEQPGARSTLCRSIANAREHGLDVIIVHGGGNQIRDLSRRLGIEDRYHEGLRITDAATADVALMVLGGLVNRTLVADLQRAGVPAVGLTGADGNLFGAGRQTAVEADGSAVDLGYVGFIQQADATIAHHLLEGGFVPVIASVAPLADDARHDPVRPAADDHFYNLNADVAAGPLAVLMECSHLLFLTDVPGVKGGDGTVTPSLDAATCEQWVADGTIAGGMIPKVRAALAAAQATHVSHRPPTVKIAPAAGEDAVSRALRDDVGTAFAL